MALTPPASPGLGGLQDGLGQHGVRVSYTDQVVYAEGSSHGPSTELLVLVLTQSGNGLKGHKHICCSTECQQHVQLSTFRLLDT